MIQLATRCFARVYGRRPLAEPVCAELFQNLSIMTEIFGPPERRGRVIYWNFDREDRMGAATIYVRIAGGGQAGDAMQVNVCGDAAFLPWLSDSLASAENGDRVPVTIGSERFTLKAASL